MASLTGCFELKSFFYIYISGFFLYQALQFLALNGVESLFTACEKTQWLSGAIQRKQENRTIQLPWFPISVHSMQVFLYLELLRGFND